MELNREQIVKVLECCAEGDCNGCPRYPFFGCVKANMAAALAIIRELTESLDRVQKQCGEIIVECDEQVAKLTEENERLRVVADMSDTTLTDALRIVNEFCDSRIKRAKADTVRRMQERFNQVFGGMDATNALLRRTFDQIAKEVLEEGK